MNTDTILLFSPRIPRVKFGMKNLNKRINYNFTNWDKLVPIVIFQRNHWVRTCCRFSRVTLNEVNIGNGGSL